MQFCTGWEVLPLWKAHRSKNDEDFTNYKVMLSPNPVPGPVSAGAAGNTWERLWAAPVQLLPLRGVQLHPLASPNSVLGAQHGSGFAQGWRCAELVPGGNRQQNLCLEQV